MKRNYIFVIKKSVLYLIIISLMLMLLMCSENTLPQTKETLLLCAENIIPTLFPFFVLSCFSIKTGFAKIAGKFLSPFMRLLFNVSGEGGVAFCIGIISGYPTGAKAVCDLYKSGDIKKQEAERLLAYCNNSGPLFVIGAVGAGMLRNASLGIFLYIIHIISAILTGIVMRFSADKSNHTNKKNHHTQAKTISIGTAFSESIKESVTSILYVCGFVVFFGAISSQILHFLGNNTLGSILKGILEVTTGISSTITDCSFSVGMPIISALLGLGGLCVFLQVMGIANESGLSLKPYVFGKIHQSIISLILCVVLLKRTNTLSVFNAQNIVNFETGNFGATITAVFIICAFYFFVLAIRKNFKKY